MKLGGGGCADDEGPPEWALQQVKTRVVQGGEGEAVGEEEEVREAELSEGKRVEVRLWP